MQNNISLISCAHFLSLSYAETVDNKLLCVRFDCALFSMHFNKLTKIIRISLSDLFRLK